MYLSAVTSVPHRRHCTPQLQLVRLVHEKRMAAQMLYLSPVTNVTQADLRTSIPNGPPETS